MLKDYVLNTIGLIPGFSYKDLCSVAIRGSLVGPNSEAAGAMVNGASVGVGIAYFTCHLTKSTDLSLSINALAFFFLSF